MLFFLSCSALQVSGPSVSRDFDTLKADELPDPAAERKAMKFRQNLAWLICGAMLAGCAQNTQQPEPSNTDTEEIKEIEADEKQTEGIYSFSWKLFNEARKKEQDAVLSPVSVFLAMGMAADGAAGNTLDQIQKAMGLDLDQMKELSRSILDASSQGSDPQFRAADSFWIRDTDSASFSESYRESLKTYFDADAEVIPFDESGVKKINDWVSEKTDGQIPTMVESLENQSAVLLNALSFDGTWMDVFAPEMVLDEDFTDASGQSETVKMMHSSESGFIETDQLKGFIKAYENGQFGFAAMIPKTDQSLEEALASTDASSIMKAVQNPEEADVMAAIPSFRLEEETGMKEALQSLGITDLFTDQADLSAMTDGKASMMVSEVLHKAKITVSSKGTKASASTGVMVDTTSLDPEEPRSEEVICNRPFLYMIVDLQTGIPMFMGTVQSIPVSAEE